ncbi:VanZ family protein [Cellulomonas denverensis]|uniref:VanZ family protein n=1 Tax=Cellulomonas denverensis TaxID=264297 RepID=UPI0035ED6E5B
MTRLVYPLFALLLVALTVLPLAWRTRHTGARPRWALPALAVWLVATAVMTLRPGAVGWRVNLVPLAFRHGGGSDLLLNIGVFVPLGILLALAGLRPALVVLTGFAVSLGIEVTQFLVASGRVSDVNDLISNTAGAALGVLLIRLADRVRARRRSAPR